MTTTTKTSLPSVGLHKGVPMDDYLGLSEAVSASGLEMIRRSPMQYRHDQQHPTESTPAMERGTALHMAVLEPDLFADSYVTLDRCEGQTQSGSRCRYSGAVYRLGSSFCRTHDPDKGAPMDVSVLKADDMADVQGMAASIHSHPRARSILEGGGGTELTGVFEDPETGVLCRFRPDRLVDRAGLLVDVKTTRDAAPWAFPADAERRGYFRKLAFYRRGLQALGWKYQGAAVIAVESTAPYDLICYLVDEGDLDTADREVSRLLRIYADCMESDDWPGYQTAEDGFATLERPAWATATEEG